MYCYFYINNNLLLHDSFILIQRKPQTSTNLLSSTIFFVNDYDLGLIIILILGFFFIKFWSQVPDW